MLSGWNISRLKKNPALEDKIIPLIQFACYAASAWKYHACWNIKEIKCYILSCCYNSWNGGWVLVVSLHSPGAKALASMSSQSGSSAAFPLFISFCVVAMASVPLPFCDGNEQPTLNCSICFTMRGLSNSPSGLGYVHARWQRRHCEETVQLQYFRVSISTHQTLSLTTHSALIRNKVF